MMYLTDTDVFLKTLTPIHEEMEIPSPVQFIKDCDKKEHEGEHFISLQILQFKNCILFLQKIISSTCGEVFRYPT